MVEDYKQSDNIEEQVTKLDGSVKASGFDLEYIHTGPVIRREDVFVTIRLLQIADFISEREGNIEGIQLQCWE